MNRRRFSRLAMTLPIAAASASHSSGSSAPAPKDETEQNTYAGGITDIPGFRVGHYTESRRSTGCTVVLCEEGAVGGVSVRGAAPGTRETDLLDPANSVQAVHGVILSGGSAYGLDTASGVMQYLEEKGIGYPVGDAIVPIVPAAIIFDLHGRNTDIRPGKAEGYQACKNATGGHIQEGSLGVGAGASVGKMLGVDRAMKGGLGSYSISVGDLTVAALAVANAVGDIIDPSTGAIIAGARQDRRSADFADIAKHLRENKIPGAEQSEEEESSNEGNSSSGNSNPSSSAEDSSATQAGSSGDQAVSRSGQQASDASGANSSSTASKPTGNQTLEDAPGQNTTLAIVATNAALTKSQAAKIADMAHDGLARAVRPAHTPADGDTIFALSTGALADFNLSQVGHLAAEAVSHAIIRAVKTAEPARGFPAYETLIQIRRRQQG
ncbi:MAG TPA: P1 family peptidase [Acidobacteriota bacterium]|nr:P1 family peptidase [Acidobacteriota bacterium]